MTFLKNWFAFYKKEISFVAIISIVASLGFAAGYLANREFTHAPIVIEACSRGNAP
jgi:hypothetical protein